MILDDWKEVLVKHDVKHVLYVTNKYGERALVTYDETCKWSPNPDNSLNVTIISEDSFEDQRWFLFDICRVDSLILIPDFENDKLYHDEICLYRNDLKCIH